MGQGVSLLCLSVWHVKVTYFGWQRSGAAAEGERGEGFGGEAPAAAADMTRPSWEGQQRAGGRAGALTAHYVCQCHVQHILS